MWFFTATFAVLCGLACLSAANGNPTAPSGIVGAGLLTVVFGTLALVERGS